MQEETARDVVLLCVNALELLPEHTPTIKQLADLKFYSRLIVLLRHEDIDSTNTNTIVATLESLLKEHFAGPKLVCFEDVVSGKELEITKLTLLLLYVTFVSCMKLNDKLIKSPLLTSQVQLKLKYLIESIQKRGSGMSVKFLNILCQEKIDCKSTARCQTPVNVNVPWGSPNVYSSSPKVSSSGTSPLRDLVQSPPFRMQKILNAKMREVKQLQQQVHAMENEKQELEIKFEATQMKASKLSNLLTSCQEDLKYQRDLRDELEARMSSGDHLVQQQVHRLSRELSAMRQENATLQDTVQRIMDNNDELTTKNNSIHSRLRLTVAERDTLEEELSSVLRAKMENESIIDDQTLQIHEFRTQLEELRQCLLENHKPSNRTIEESFEFGSPVNFSDSSPSHSGATTENTSEENMADMVIDKILTETRMQLAQLQEQHTALQNQMTDITCSRDQLHSQVESLRSENEIITSELGEISNSFSNISDAHSQLRTQNGLTLQNLQEAQSKNEELELERKRLQDAITESQEIVAGLQERLSSCTVQLKGVEEQLQNSDQKLQVTNTALEEVNRAKCSLQEDFSRTVAKMSEDSRVQLAALNEEHEKKVDEITSNLSLMFGECETLRFEKTTLRQQVENKEAAISSLTKDLEAVKEEKSNLMSHIEIKTNEYMMLQQQIDRDVEIFIQEKTTLIRNFEETKEKNVQLQKDLEANLSQYTNEKVLLAKEIADKESEYLSLKEEKENVCFTLSHLENETKALIEALKAEKGNLTTELKSKEDFIQSLHQQIETKLAEFDEERKKFFSEIEKQKSTECSLLKQVGDLKEKYLDEKESLQKELLAIKETLKVVEDDKEMTSSSLQQEKNSLSELLKVKEGEYISLLNEKNSKIELLNQEKTNLTDNMKLKEETILELERHTELNAVAFEDQKSALQKEMELKSNELAELQLEMEKSQQSFMKEKDELRSEIEEKESHLLKLKTEHHQTVEVLMQEKTLLNETILSKEELLSSLQQEIKSVTEKLNLDNEAKENKCQSLQQELEITRSSLNEENSTLLQDFKMKEDKYVTTQHDMEEALASLNEKNDTLNIDIKHKEELINSMKLQMDERVESFGNEKVELTESLKAQEKEIGELKEIMCEAQKQHSLSVEQMQNEVNKVTSEYEKQRAMNEDLKLEVDSITQEISLKVADHEKVFAGMQQEMADKIDRLNCCIAEKEQTVEELEQQRQETMEKYSDDIKKLKGLLEDNKNVIESSEQVLLQAKLQHEERVSALSKELCDVRVTLETFQKERLEEIEIKSKKIEELSLALAEMTSNAASVKTEVEQAKEEIAQQKQEVQKLSDVLKDKEATYTHKITFLMEQVSVLESEKEKVLQGSRDYETTLSALAAELTSQKAALISAEEERKELNDVLSRERTSTGEIIRVQEEALNSLKQKVENAFEDRTSEKDDLCTKIEQMQAEYDLLKKEIDDHMMKCEENKVSLGIQIKERDEVILRKEEEMERYTQKVNEEKATLCRDIEAKDEFYQELKQEMERTITLLKDEKIQEIAAKEELISKLGKEKENALESYRTEKAHLKDVFDAKEGSLSHLQQKLEEINAITRTEKDSLLQKLLTSQKDLASLQKSYEISQESFDNERALLNKEIQEKKKLHSDLQEETKLKHEESHNTIKELECKLEKITADVSMYKSTRDELNERIQSLNEEIIMKDALRENELSLIRGDLEEKILKLNGCVSEKSEAYEALQKRCEEMTENHSLEVTQLQTAVSEKNQCIESLEKEKSEVEKVQDVNVQKINSLNDEISIIKKKLEYFEEALDEKEGFVEESVRTLMAEKEEVERVSKHTIEELNKSLTEKSQMIVNVQQELEERRRQFESDLHDVQRKLKEEEEESTKEHQSEKEALVASLQNKVSDLESAKQQLMTEQNEHSNLRLKVASLEEEIITKEKIYLSNMEELKVAQHENKKFVSRVRSLEAKLIDSDKEVTAAKEEIMRVEREEERSKRSLIEELQATKEKYRAERQEVVDKMKASYKTEMEKVLIDIQDRDQMGRDNKIYKHKYEVAKKKLAETFGELNDVKTSNEHYQTQMVKYKEHMTKISDNLKKEQSRNAELIDMHHPLKEKLKEAEQTIRRLDNEKRSLDTQVKLADSQMRDMKRQWNLENFNIAGVPKSKMSARVSLSESQLVTVAVSRPISSSSAEGDLSGNDSSQKLLGSRQTKTKGRQKPLSRAASSETVFRKPDALSLSIDARQKSVNVANLAAAAAASSARLRNEVAAMGKSTSDKSLGRSVPRDMLFNCEDEEEQFSNKFLLDMQVGRCNPRDDEQWKRLSELQRRNSLYPPHMRSAYPAEMQFAPLEDFEDDKLRAGCAVEERQLLNLTQATENLGLDSPAFNLRKRKSLSDSTNSEISVDSLGGKKNKRLSTSYSRPGPPTPARRYVKRGDKENFIDHDTSQISTESRESKASPTSAGTGGSPVSTRSRQHLKDSSARSTNSPSSSLNFRGSRSRRTTLSPGGVSFLSKKGLNVTPRGKKGMTPSSIRKILSRGKSPWRKLDSDQETPKGLGDSTGSTGSSKLRIFRKPFGSRNYNLLSASRRSQENAQDPNSSLAASTGRLDPVIANKSKSRR